MEIKIGRKLVLKKRHIWFRKPQEKISPLVVLKLAFFVHLGISACGLLVECFIQLPLSTEDLPHCLGIPQVCFTSFVGFPRVPDQCVGRS